MKLYEIAKLIRSKNAGPFNLTVDIMFDTLDKWESVANSGAINADDIARMFGMQPEDIEVFPVRNALAIKVSFPRPVFQGEIADADMLGGQQYATIMEIDIPGTGSGNKRRSLQMEETK